MKARYYNIVLSLFCIGSTVMFSNCSKDDIEKDHENSENPELVFPGESSGIDDSDAPDFNPVIEPWNGEKANDASKDKVDGNNADIYHEANTFSEKVVVKYEGTSASVSLAAGSKVKYKIAGAYVTIDLMTNSVKDIEIIASGKSDDGQLKIYGEKKFKLTLSGLELTSLKGPAINNQCKKRVFIHLTAGTSNKLTDCKSYSKEPYYLTNTGEVDEDRKGCFFSEGDMIFSGSGVLEVAGKYRHGIVTDGYLWIRPGVTLVVSEAAKNAVHVKGDATDNIGFYMAGGLLYTNVSSLAGKSIKSDLHAVVSGGKLLLNQSGDSTFDEEDNDTSSPAGIKTEGNIVISGGDLIVKSTGSGGKGLHSNGRIRISGGETTITTTGQSYFKAQDMVASPKGMKANGNIDIDGGILNIAVTGKAESFGNPKGLESKAVLTVSGGEVYSYATDDAITAVSGIVINNGRIFAHSTDSNGIESDGELIINGGLAIANGASGNNESIACASTSKFIINGGIIFGTGGTCVHAPSSSSKQRSVIYGGLTVAKNDYISVTNSAGKPTISYKLPRGMKGMVLFYSSSDLKSGETYNISLNGKLSDWSEMWNNCFSGGIWNDGTKIGSFIPEGTVTVIGQN